MYIYIYTYVYIMFMNVMDRNLMKDPCLWVSTRRNLDPYLTSEAWSLGEASAGWRDIGGEAAVCQEFGAAVEAGPSVLLGAP